MTEEEYKGTMSSLSLVCRFFRAVCLSRLFSSLTFKGDSNNASRQAWCKRLGDKDARSVQLGSYVKQCTFTQWTPPTEAHSWVYSVFLAKYFQACTHFTSLQFLAVVHTEITAQFFNAIIEMRNLRTVSLESCHFALPDRYIPIPTSTTRWTTFVLVFAIDVEPYMPTITAFVNASVIREMRTNNWDLLRHIAQHEECALEKLTLELRDVAAPLNDIWDVLEHTPRVTHLSFDTAPSDSFEEDEYMLSETSLPLLRVINGPAELVSKLVPGRPVSEITLQMPTWPGHRERDARGQTILGRLLGSTERVIKLQAPPWICFARPLHESFPHLEHLRVNFRKDLPENYLPALCEEWRQLDSLKSLALRFSIHTTNPELPCNLELQRKYIQEYFANSAPSVTRISLHYMLEWRRQDLEVDSKRWQPAPLGSRLALHDWLLGLARRPASIDKIKDFDGFFASLFSREELDMLS
ncbi:hypothetical protein AcV5_003161 [Taiwanofungus camphoratus]|nr:hypothetical protein AcV5_003161 [Antrodia cinnamomea]